MATNSPNEWFFERAGKKVDRSVDYAERKYNQAKETVSKWIDNATNFVNKKAEQWINAVKKWLNVLGNTYRDVSNKISQKVNAVKDWAIKAIDRGAERATNQLKQLDWVLRNLDKAIKSGALKAIERSAETGTMVLLIWKEKVKYTINSVKREISTIWNAIKNKTIQWVVKLKEAWMVGLKMWEKVVKVSIAAAIASGIAFYKWWQLMVNKTKLAVNNVKQDVVRKVNTAKQAVGRGVARAQAKVADDLRNAADRIDPRYIAAK